MHDVAHHDFFCAEVMMKKDNVASYLGASGFCAWMALSALTGCADAGSEEAGIDDVLVGLESTGDLDEVRSDSGAVASSASLMAERLAACVTNRETTSYAETSEMLSCVQDVNRRGARTVDGRLRAMATEEVSEARDVEMTHLTKYRATWSSLCDRVHPTYDPSDPDALSQFVANGRCLLDSEIGLAISVARIGLGGDASLAFDLDWSWKAFRPASCSESLLEEQGSAETNLDKLIALESFVYCTDDGLSESAEIYDSAHDLAISEMVDSLIDDRGDLCDRLAHSRSYLSLDEMEEPLRRDTLASARANCERLLQSPLAETLAFENE